MRVQKVWGVKGVWMAGADSGAVLVEVGGDEHALELLAEGLKRAQTA